MRQHSPAEAPLIDAENLFRQPGPPQSPRHDAGCERRVHAPSNGTAESATGCAHKLGRQIKRRRLMRCETLVEFAGGRLVSPSAERNKSPIAEVLKRVLPGHGVVLEVSSGTGQHVVHFAREMPHLTWQPSERDEASLQSITHWVAAEALPNI